MEDNSVIDTLGTLRDIDGIQGSFLVSESGGVLARDMPRVVDDAALSEAAPRLWRMLETVESDQPVDSAVFRFTEHRLELRFVGEKALLCVLADASVNQPALRMALKLVCRKLSTQPLGGEARASLPPPSVTPPKVSSMLAQRYYRGHPVPR